MTSKIVAEFSAKSLTIISGENLHLVNDNLVIELIETLLVDELASAAVSSSLSSSGTVTSTATAVSSTTNYDNLWHIISLLTLSPVQLINDRLTLLRVRSLACDLVIKFFFAQQNPNVMRALTRSAAWQDIVCQLFCVERLPVSNNNSGNGGSSTGPPPIVISNASKQKFSNTNDEDDDVWENLDYNGKFKDSNLKLVHHKIHYLLT